MRPSIRPLLMGIRLTSLMLATLMLAALLLAPERLSASVPFDSAQTITSRNGANDVHAGDLDGDLVPDMVGLGGGKLVVGLNDGDGSSWTVSDLVNSTWPRQIEFADVDGDTDLDIIHTDFHDGQVYCIPNNLNTSGTFGARRRVGSVMGADGVFAVNLDGDTDVDLVVAARAADAYYWFENTDGSGENWTIHTIAKDLDAPQTVWVADLDGDTDLDIVGGGAENNGQLVWFENTLGDASTWSLKVLHSAWINAVAVADVDHDGDPDIVVQENDAGPATSDVFMWWENTLGDASTWVEQSIGAAGRDASKGLQLVDLDQDGDLDVVGDRNGDWHENLFGDASAWTQHSFSTADDVHDTDVSDFDGDGDLDIIGARLERDRLVWWPNLTCSPADPDDDSDGYRNDCDVCDGFDDALDDDDDGVPDGCDACPGADDRVDLDDDDIPDACEAMLSLGDATENEGDSGNTIFTFTATLTGSTAIGFTVPYSTSDGTATTADGDYVADAGSLSFTGTDGEIQTILVDIPGDSVVESDEDFIVLLGSPSVTGVAVLDDTGLGTIQNDDAASVAIGDVDQAEGNSGSTTYSFTVTLTGDVAGGFTLPYATTDGSATTADGDYVANAGSLSFAGTEGETQTILVDVPGDIIVETNESFTVDLGSPSTSGITVTDGSGLGTIRNDDSATIAIDDVDQVEGNSGTTVLSFTVTLTGSVVGDFTVPYASADGTATTANGDYVTVTGSLNFTGTDGDTQTILVDVPGDSVVEDDEIFTVLLGSPSNADVTVMDGSGLGTIRNDDSATIAIGDVDQAEGDSGITTLSFTVTLTGEVAGGFTLPYATADGSATTADGDYVANAGSLSFAGTEGETQTILVDVPGDSVVEGDETFTVLLGAPSNANVMASDGAALGILRNDDIASVAIGDVDQAEGGSGTTTYSFTVLLAGSVVGGFTVPYTTSDGTATTADGDYVAAAGSLGFTGTDGETRTIQVDVEGDHTVEPDEVFTVLLAAPSNANVSVSDSIALGTLRNDDPPLFANGFETGDTSFWSEAIP